jgi:endonuclease-3
MTRKEKYRFVINYFVQNNPDAKTELMYDNPYELLVAVILSAQCTDKRVNITTPFIFEIYPDIHLLARLHRQSCFRLLRAFRIQTIKPII